MGTNSICEYEGGNQEILENCSLKEVRFLRVGLCYGCILRNFFIFVHELELDQNLTASAYLLLGYVGGKFHPRGL